MSIKTLHLKIGRQLKRGETWLTKNCVNDFNNLLDELGMLGLELYWLVRCACFEKWLLIYYLTLDRVPNSHQCGSGNWTLRVCEGRPHQLWNWAIFWSRGFSSLSWCQIHYCWWVSKPVSLKVHFLIPLVPVELLVCLYAFLMFWLCLLDIHK